MNEKLAQLEFGRGAAQLEDNLHQFFYRSGAYQSAISGDIYLILGAKGAGKSAIFQRLKGEATNILTFQKPNAVIVDEPLGLRDLWPILSKVSTSRTNLWKLYFASLAAAKIVENPLDDETLTEKCGRFLARWGLVGDVPTRWQELRALKFKVGWGNWISSEFPPKTELNVGEIDTVLMTISKYYQNSGGKLWFCVDSLDEVTINGQSSISTEDILGDCMKAVGEIIRLAAIKIKLFFRTDIYNRLTYVNKDHFSSSKLELDWSRDDLAILLAHRLAILHPKHGDLVPVAVANTWIDAIFEWGDEVRSFDDLYVRLQDGQGNVLPRDLVHFCIQAKRQQMTYNIQGTNKPSGERLFSVKAVNDALEATANAKLTDFLNVFKMFSATVDQLRGHPSANISREELILVLGKSALDSAQIINDLWQVGVLKVLDRKSINQAKQFEIPYLYAKALNLGEENA